MFTFLNIYGGILAPLAAIFIIDYWMHKHQRVEVVELYNDSKDGRYYYQGGFNINAIIAWVAGAILPTIYSIVSAAAPNGNAFLNNSIMYYINVNAYFFAFAVAFVVYLLIGKGKMTAKSRLTQEDLDAISMNEEAESA